MTLEFIGLVGAHESSESLAAQGPIVDLPFIKAFSHAQEYAGFDDPCQLCGGIHR